MPVVNRGRWGARNTHALCADAVPAAIRQACTHRRRRRASADINDVASVATIGGCIPWKAPHILWRVARLRHVPVYGRLARDMNAPDQLTEIQRRAGTWAAGATTVDSQFIAILYAVVASRTRWAASAAIDTQLITILDVVDPALAAT